MQENYPFLVAVKPLKQEFEKYNKISISSEEVSVERSLLSHRTNPWMRFKYLSQILLSNYYCNFSSRLVEVLKTMLS